MMSPYALMTGETTKTMYLTLLSTIEVEGTNFTELISAHGFPHVEAPSINPENFCTPAPWSKRYVDEANHLNHAIAI